jgi:hypothetical protein
MLCSQVKRWVMACWEAMGGLGSGRAPRPVPPGAPGAWEGLTIHRTGGRHGREEAMVRGLGPVSGFVVAASGEPTVCL